MRSCAEIFHPKISVMQSNIWNSQVLEIGNYEILFEHLSHESEAVPKFTSWYGTS